MTKTYTPKPTVAAALRWMIAQGEGAEVTSAEIAAACGMESKEVIGYFMGAIDAGAVQCIVRDGVRRWKVANKDIIVLGDSEAPPTRPRKRREPEALPEAEPDGFDAALWADGHLVLVGAEIMEDGNVVLPPDQAARLKRLLCGEAV